MVKRKRDDNDDGGNIPPHKIIILIAQPEAGEESSDNESNESGSSSEYVPSTTSEETEELEIDEIEEESVGSEESEESDENEELEIGEELGRQIIETLFSGGMRPPPKYNNEEDPDDVFSKQLTEIVATDENKQVLAMKLKEYRSENDGGSEKNKMGKWLKHAFSLPFQRIKPIIYDNKTHYMMNVMKELDRRLYGMREAKEQILLYLNTKLDSPETNMSLGLIGPPGCGKSMLARTLAEVI